MELDVIKYSGEGQDSDVKKLCVSELLEELIDAAEPMWAEVHERALMHERTYHGQNTYGDREENGAESGVMSKNILRILVNSYSARAADGAPQTVAYPAHPEYADAEGAKLANYVIQHISRENNVEVKDYRVLQNGQLHGAGFCKSFWDKNMGDAIIRQKQDKLGPVFDAEGNPEMELAGYEGNVRHEIVTVFDGAFGPGDDIERANWFIQRSFVSKDEALHELHMAGKSQDNLPQEVSYERVGAAKQAKGFELWEVWYRPGWRFPNGVYAKILGRDCELHAGEFPYEHGQLPYSVWQPEVVDGVCFGTSHVFDNYKLQRRLNLVEEKKDKIVEIGGGVICIASDELADQIEDGNSIVRALGPGLDQVRFVSIDNFPPILQTRGVELQEAMHDNAGQNEVLIGSANIKSGTASKAYEFLARSDAKKMAPALARFRAYILRRDRQALKLFQQFAETERKIAVVGENEAPFVELIDRMRVNGTDLILETVSSYDNMRSAKAQGAPENAQLGIISPTDVPEIAQTGLPMTMDSAAATQKAQQLIKAVGTGNQQLPGDASIPPAIALAEIAKFESLGFGDTNVSALQRLREFYQQLAAQSAMQQQGAPNAQQ